MGKLPGNISITEHQALAELHRAANSTRLGRALFELITPRLPHELIFIALLPIKFELPSLCSEPKYQELCNEYVRRTNRYDIWLRRSPVGPHVKAVRHSDYTPYHILRRTLFFKEVMTPLNSHFGASIVAWEKEQWLATLTVFRTYEQGDFSEADMQLLLNWQTHFEVAVRRIAHAKESSLDDRSLAGFIWDLPTAALMFDWDIQLRHYNAAGEDLCRLWLNPHSRGRIKLGRKKPVIPHELTVAMEALKPVVEKAKLSRPGPVKSVELKTVRHPRVADFFAKIYFIPSKSLALTRGRFLVQLHNSTASGSSAVSRLSQLTRRERETALLAAQGLTNREIARNLTKSPGTVKIQLEHVFKKLKIKSRVQLAALLSK